MVSAEVFDCFDPASTQYFFEPGKSNDIEPFADENLLSISTLATMSPDVRRYNEYRKLATIKFMPVYAEDELVAIGRDMRTRPDFDSDLESLYSDDAIRARFATFNGIIRPVLPQSESDVRQVHEQRDAALKSIDPAKFLSGNLEDGSVSHLVAVYNAPVDLDFSTGDSLIAAPDATEILQLKSCDLVSNRSVWTR
jgi:hypothetical protein